MYALAFGGSEIAVDSASMVGGKGGGMASSVSLERSEIECDVNVMS